MIIATTAPPIIPRGIAHPQSPLASPYIKNTARPTRINMVKKILTRFDIVIGFYKCIRLLASIKKSHHNFKLNRIFFFGSLNINLANFRYFFFKFFSKAFQKLFSFADTQVINHINIDHKQDFIGTKMHGSR